MPTIASVTVTYGRKYQIRKDDWIALEATITMRVDETEADQVDPRSVTAEAFSHAQASILEQQETLRRELAETQARALVTRGQLHGGALVGDQQPIPVPPSSVEEAEQRFYTRYADVIGGRTWADVQRFTGIRTLPPTTIKAWYSVAEAVVRRIEEHSAIVANGHQ
jgi:hypothetical protein